MMQSESFQQRELARRGRHAFETELIHRSRRTSSSTNENDVAGVELGTRPDGTGPDHEHLADVESSTGEQPSAMYRRGCRHKPSIEPGLRQEAIGVASPEGTPW